MEHPFELLQHGVAFVGLAMAACAASLAACIIYRRASSSMFLLILAFAGNAFVMLLLLILDLVQQFMPGLLDYNMISPMILPIALLGLGLGVLTAVGLFRVLGDVVRRLDRSGAGGPDDDYRRRRSTFDQGSDPNWKSQPGGTDIRR